MAKKKKGKKKEKKAGQAPEIPRMAEEEFAPIREGFVQEWSKLMVGWGFPKALGTVHATLLAQAEPASMSEVIEATGLSQGTAHTMLKRLVAMRLAHEEHRHGSRLVRYIAERDVWQVALAALKARRERELEPLLAMREWVERLPDVDGQPVMNEDGVVDSAAVLGATMRPVLRWAEQVDELFKAFEVEDERWWMRLVKRWKTRS